MKTKVYSILLSISICGASFCQAQSGFLMPPGMKQMDIPFEYINNFIIVTVMFNRALPLKMIFDSGAEHTILSKREVSDFMRVRYEREFRLVGADLSTELIAYLARNIRLETPGLPLVAAKEDILVLQEDYFRFEEYAGVNVHGILAAQAFFRYFIKINYEKKVITLFNREGFVLPEAGYKQVPVEVFRNKIYLNTTASFRADSSVHVKLLLDTGAALPLLLFSNTHSAVTLPQNTITTNIGMGLGGFLEGSVGRTEKLSIGPFNQNGLVTFFQELDTTKELSYLNNRNGLIGNILLSRFSVIFDYYGECIWIKPSNSFKKKHTFDRSGLVLIAGGRSLNHFTIQGIVPNSPGSEAGLLPGDRILRVGITPVGFLGLEELHRVFKKKPGKKLKIVVKRNGKRLKKMLVLRELI